MKLNSDEIVDHFWIVFRRVLNVEGRDLCLVADGLEEWDSLKHIELIFELEDAFGLEIPADDIVALFSDTDTVISYLLSRQASKAC